MAEVIVETARLVLRRWRDHDFAPWLEHLNTPQVKAFLGGVQPLETMAERFAKLERAWDVAGYSFLAVERCEDRAFLGACGIGRIETASAPDGLRGEVEIGWQLRADCWGQGYATEAARAVLAMAFERFAFPTVFAQTSENNRASWRVMERLGMARRADLDYPDPDYPPQDNPTMVYALPRADWEARQT
ncbi:MAG: hypothetical protein B7Z33_02115 [Sphingomonadales bacterium 12-68-11]|nr:MAG: hypothetical protein B7Z33_02115 [Sphingomonadales bacterium 12-68-11]